MPASLAACSGDSWRRQCCNSGGRRLGTENAIAPFDDVEVTSKMRRLSQQVFDHQGDDRLLGLAQQGLVGVRKRFFASCWVMVDPPATMRPRFWFFPWAFF